jgi:hypothetical protein
MITFPQTSSNADIITVKRKESKNKSKVKVKARGIIIILCSAAKIENAFRTTVVEKSDRRNENVESTRDEKKRKGYQRRRIEGGRIK